MLCPIKLHLHVLQLEGYDVSRFLSWLRSNYFVRSLEKKKPLVWTSKAKNILLISVLIYLLCIAFLLLGFGIFGLLFASILFCQPWLFLILGVLVLKPYEYVNRLRVRALIKKKIIKLKKKGLVVIGITGSYGKTTTKNFLYELLKSKYKVLRTPESYNTLFGIYKVVDLELSDTYEYFICEMGAYHIGEIKELCDVVVPDHGILIGINEQHLERFGSIKNTIKAKFELIQAIASNEYYYANYPGIDNANNNSKGYCVLNVSDENVRHSYAAYTDSPILYGNEKNSDLTNNTFSEPVYKDGYASTEMSIFGNKIHLDKLNILGEGNISNALGASLLAYKLGVSLEEIAAVLNKLEPTPHRLELVNKENGLTIIDDAYSSNVAGFKVALEYLKTFKNRTKVIVTPGIVELGNETSAIHKDLGLFVDEICDHVLLVGKNERTFSLADSITPEKTIFINSINEMPAILSSLNLTTPVVLIENDLPENY